jgi:hypothetical protein
MGRKVDRETHDKAAIHGLVAVPAAQDFYMNYKERLKRLLPAGYARLHGGRDENDTEHEEKPDLYRETVGETR